MPKLLITGGTGKFGQKLVSHFSSLGWEVLFSSRSQGRADSLSDQIASETETKPLGLVADLMQAEGLDSFSN